MLSHGGCIARGKDAAHVFALVHGFDAAAEIQVYAEMTGMPLLELPKDQVLMASFSSRPHPNWATQTQTSSPEPPPRARS